MLVNKYKEEIIMNKTELVDFTIEPLNKLDKFYGFELKDDPLHQMYDGSIFHNSGKSVLEQSI